MGDNDFFAEKDGADSCQNFLQIHLLDFYGILSLNAEWDPYWQQRKTSFGQKSPNPLSRIDQETKTKGKKCCENLRKFPATGRPIQAIHQSIQLKELLKIPIVHEVFVKTVFWIFSLLLVL